MKPTQLIQIINTDFGVDISIKNKSENIVFVRDLYFALSHKLFYPIWTYGQLASQINRDHSTMIHSLNKRKKNKKQFEETLATYWDSLKDVTPSTDTTTKEIMSKKLLSVTEKYNALQVEHQLLKMEFKELKNTHFKLKMQKEGLIDLRLKEFSEEVQELLRMRIGFILDAESKKVYSYA